MPSPPFVDPRTIELDTAQLVSEAVPLAELIGVFAAAALVPFGLTVLAFVGQFVLAVGTVIVLMCVVARGEQLA